MKGWTQRLWQHIPRLDYCIALLIVGLCLWRIALGEDGSIPAVLFGVFGYYFNPSRRRRR